MRNDHSSLQQLKHALLTFCCLFIIFFTIFFCRLTSAGGAASSGTGKRFLILTYAVEFDRVHYPLPLTPEVSPSPEVLQRTIRRLKQALAEKDKSSNVAGGVGGESRLAEENAVLREENRCLKNTLTQYCDGTRDGGGAVLNSTGELQRELEVRWVIVMRCCGGVCLG